MSYSRTTRKHGAGIVQILAHSGNTTPYYGERDYATIKASASTLGGLTDGAELGVSGETHEDMVNEEMFPIQLGVDSMKTTFKVKMNAGDAANLAIACGKSAKVSETMDGVTSYTSVIGTQIPTFWTILHSVKNPHNASINDRIYIPRAQIDPNWTFVHGREARTIEVTFFCYASQQDGSTGVPTSTDMRIKDSAGNATGMGSSAKFIEEYV